MSRFRRDLQASNGSRPAFACNWTSAPGAGYVTLAGELDIAQGARLEEALRGAETAAAELIVLDLRELCFIDCSGARVILGSAERLRQAERRLIVVRGPRPVDMVLELVAAADSLAIVDLGPNEPAAHALLQVAAEEEVPD